MVIAFKAVRFGLQTLVTTHCCAQSGRAARAPNMNSQMSHAAADDDDDARGSRSIDSSGGEAGDLLRISP